MPFPMFDKEEDVPEAFRPSYAPRADGKWAPKKDDIVDASLGDPGKAAIIEERQKVADLSDRVRVLTQQVADLTVTATARDNNIPEAVLAKIRDTAVAPLTTELTTTKEENRKLKHEDRVMAKWRARGPMLDREEEAKYNLMKRSRVGDQDGIVWLDKDGKDTTDTDEQFFTKFKVEKGFLFIGQAGSGGDAQQSGAPDPEPKKPKAPDTKKISQVRGSF